MRRMAVPIEDAMNLREGFSVGSCIHNTRLSVYQLYFGKKLSQRSLPTKMSAKFLSEIKLVFRESLLLRTPC